MATRLRYNGLQATLGAAISSTSATSITFAAALQSMGANIPTLGDEYLALTIDDEIVHLTAYTSGATSGTIVRGQEGTTAATHGNGATVVHGPTALDFSAPSPDDPPTNPDSFNNEFARDNASSLPSGWQWVNQGSSTYLERYGGGALRAGGNTGWNNRIIDRAVPSGTSWTVDAKLRYEGRNANYWQSGLVLRDDTSGKFVAIANDGRGPCYVLWNSPTSYSGESTHYPMGLGADEFYVRIIKNSSSSYDFGFSGDGWNWTMLFAAFDAASFVGTVDRIGLVANAEYGGTTYPITVCNWMRKVA